jgi:apolipoprotein N-acyltransferase
MDLPKDVQSRIFATMRFSISDYLRGVKPWQRCFLIFLGGALGALALPPVSIPFFFFAGFAVFAVLLPEARSFKAAFGYGWLYALGYHLAGLYWISASLFVDIERYLWVLPFSLLALPAWLALLFAAGTAAAHPLRQKPVSHALALACTLFLSEMLRSWLLTGFPWNLFGNIWSDNLFMLQAASLTGAYGLTLLTLLAAASFALLLRSMQPAHLLLATGFAAILSGMALWGAWRLETTPVSFYPDVRLRIVQANIAQSDRRTEAQRVDAVRRNMALSTGGAEKPVTHLLWPETAAPFFLAHDDEAREVLSRIVPPGGVLITGAPGKEKGLPHYYNSLMVLDRAGSLTGIYDKSHLVPFGEYVPFRNILKTVPVAADVIGSGDFIPGPGPRTLRASGFPSFAPMICYEAIFSHQIVDRKDPPDVLLQITNDAWFGNTSGPYQHFAMARMRAVEEGLPLLRAANSGISAVTDPLGRITAMLPLNARGTLDVDVPKPLKDTFGTTTLYSKIGYWPFLVTALTILSGIVIKILFSKKP